MRVADEIADILLREGIDYVQSKAVFRAARIKAGLHAPKETRTAPARLTLEEQLRFIDAAYARNGRTGLMVQTLLETGARVSEFVALRVEDVSLGERTIAVESGKGGKRREIPFRAELARLLAMHITDIQKFLGHEDIGATRIYAETSVAMLRRKFDQVTDPAGSDLLGAVRTRHGDVVGAFAADLLTADGHPFNTPADA